MSRSLRHRRARGAGIALVSIVIFIVVLVVWVGKQPPGFDSVASASGTPSVPQPASGAPVALPRLTDSPDISDEQGRHQVTIEASSDATILALRFGIRGGSPSTAAYTNVPSPLHVISPARGNGVLAVVQVQASLSARQVTCSITVDGVVRSEDTATGPHSVAVCVG